MKDALGHGSNAGTSSAPTFGKRSSQGGAGDSRAVAGSGLRDHGRVEYRDDTSNAEAARSLMGALRSTMAPVHPSMRSGQDRTQMPGPRPDISAALRQRSYAGTAFFGNSNWGRALKR